MVCTRSARQLEYHSLAMDEKKEVRAPKIDSILKAKVDCLVYDA